MSRKRLLLFSVGGDRSWALFDAEAESLGLSREGLFAQLHYAGKTLAEVVGGPGVDSQGPRTALLREWGSAFMGSTCFLNQFFIFAAYD